MIAYAARYPFRKVLRYEETTTRYNRPYEGCYHFYLECGHEMFAKMSCGLPKRKRCRDCYLLEAGLMTVKSIRRE